MASVQDSGIINVDLPWEETRERTWEELTAEEIIQLQEMRRAEIEVYAFGLIATTLGIDPGADRAWAAVNGALIRRGIEPSEAQQWLPACNYDLTCFAMQLAAALLRQHALMMAYLFLATTLDVDPANPETVSAALALRHVSLDEANDWIYGCNYDLVCFGQLVTDRLGLEKMTAEQELALRKSQEDEARTQIQSILVAGLGLPPGASEAEQKAELIRRGISHERVEDWTRSCDFDPICFRQTMNAELYVDETLAKERRTKLLGGVSVLALVGVVLWWRRR